MSNCEYAQKVKKGMIEYLRCSLNNKECKFTRYCIHERSVKNTDDFLTCKIRAEAQES